MKKILGAALYILFAGLLVVGGMIRTRAVTGQGSEAGEGNGNDLSHRETDTSYLSVSGRVAARGEEEILVQTEQGQQISIAGRAVQFLEDAKFSLPVGTRVDLRGFFEGELFEVAQIHLPDSGEMISLRDSTGRPQWAGRGRGARP